MSPELVGLVGFFAVLVLLMLRMHVGLAMIVVSVFGYAYLVSPSAALIRLGQDPFQSATSYTLSVIPLFVLMGYFIAQARIGHDLYAGVNAIIGRARGGLGIATLGAAGLFASVSGSGMAAVTTLSAVAIPEMRRYGYADRIAVACAAVGGTLGILIPPSAVLVLYAILTEESVGAVLMAGIVPGIITALMLMATTYVIARLRPDLAPRGEAMPPRERLRKVGKIWAVPLIFLLSMGGIYGGVFTPTEAGSVGAALALVVALAMRRMNPGRFIEALGQTVRVTAMIF